VAGVGVAMNWFDPGRPIKFRLSHGTGHNECTVNHEGAADTIEFDAVPVFPDGDMTKRPIGHKHHIHIEWYEERAQTESERLLDDLNAEKAKTKALRKELRKLKEGR